jgi:hypothetical protein
MEHAKRIWVALAPKSPELDEALASLRAKLAQEPPEPAPAINLDEAPEPTEGKGITPESIVDDDPFANIFPDPPESEAITVAQLASELGMDPFDVLDKLDRWLGIYVLSTTSVIAEGKANALRSRHRQEGT